jgi:hypothetical protein
MIVKALKQVYQRLQLRIQIGIAAKLLSGLMLNESAA